MASSGLLRLPGRLRQISVEDDLARRYLSAESLVLVLVDEDERNTDREEVRALQPA